MYSESHITYFKISPIRVPSTILHHQTIRPSATTRPSSITIVRGHQSVGLFQFGGWGKVYANAVRCRLNEKGWNGNIQPFSNKHVSAFVLILREESPSLCKFSLPIGQRLRYAAARWMFCLPVDSNIRYDDHPRAVICNRSFRDTV